jgi:hypothetical protein
MKVKRFTLLGIVILMMVFVLGASSAYSVYIVPNDHPFDNFKGFHEAGPTWYYPSSGGYEDNGYQYTGNSGTGGYTEFGAWQLFVSGFCNIYTFIPAQDDATQNAEYWGVIGSTQTWLGRWNQRTNGNQWLTLWGTNCQFPGLLLKDATIELPLTTAVLYDDTVFQYPYQ